MHVPWQVPIAIVNGRHVRGKAKPEPGRVYCKKISDSHLPFILRDLESACCNISANDDTPVRRLSSSNSSNAYLHYCNYY